MFGKKKGRQQQQPDYNNMTVEELRQHASEQDIPNRSGMNKDDLIRALTSGREEGEPERGSNPGQDSVSNDTSPEQYEGRQPENQGENDPPLSSDLESERGPDQGVEPNPAQQEGKSLRQSLAENEEHQKAMAEFNKHPEPAPARDEVTGDVIGITPGDTVPKHDYRVVKDDPHPAIHEPKGFVRIGNNLINFASISVVTLPAPNNKSNSITVTMNNGAKFHCEGKDSQALMAAFGPCCEKEMNVKSHEDVRALRENQSKKV